MASRTPPKGGGKKGNSISITDVGPINHFEFKLLHGLNVLRGKNSAGKTTALKAAEALTTGREKKDLVHRDGATIGEVSGLGIVMTIGKKPTRTGILEVDSLEGRFSVLDIVEPKIDDPIAADKKRIKALIQLSLGQQVPDQSLFYGIFGGQEQFDMLVSTKTKETDDVVLMAARIKADAEDKARKLEDEAKKQIGHAEACRNATAGIDLEAPDDEKKLAEDYKLAVAEEARIKAEKKAIDDAIAAAATARTALASAVSNRGANELLEAETKLATEQKENERLTKVVDERRAKVEEVKLLLARAEAELQEAHTQRASSDLRIEAAENAVAAVKSHEETLAQWRAALDAGNVKQTITDADIAEAEEDVKIAQEEMQQGAVIRAAKEKVKEAEAHMERAATLRDEADRLREAGRATDNVLSELVSRLGCPLTVRHGRLMADVGKGEEVFDRLGRGDQWTLVIKDIAAPALGENGVLVIKQEGYEGMDLEHRDLAHAAAIEKKLYILTAAWSMDPELKAEVYEPTK